MIDDRYNLIMVELLTRKATGNLTRGDASELIESALAVLRSAVKPDSDRAQVSIMIATVRARLTKEFIQ